MADELSMRIDLLEEKFAHQERYLDSLNEVVLRQQRQLDDLLEELRRLRGLLLEGEPPFPGGHNTPPPHY